MTARAGESSKIEVLCDELRDTQYWLGRFSRELEAGGFKSEENRQKFEDMVGWHAAEEKRLIREIAAIESCEHTEREGILCPDCGKIFTDDIPFWRGDHG